MGLFATHPPVEKRVQALMQYGGGRDAAPAQPAPQATVAADAPDPTPSGQPGPWGQRRDGPPGPWG